MQGQWAEGNRIDSKVVLKLRTAGLGDGLDMEVGSEGENGIRAPALQE